MFAALTLASTFCVSLEARNQTLETAIEATFLYKFAPYVEWPAEKRGGDFVLCIAGSDPFSDLLDRAVAGELIEGRPVVVRRLAFATAESPCDIMYIAGSAAQSVAQALTALSSRPILTITDSERNGGPRGIINFVVQGNHVRFEIDEAMADHVGLRVSSKLLSLAVSVKRRP